MPAIVLSAESIPPATYKRIRTSKSAPRPSVSTLSRPNAPTPCAFLTSQLPKVARSCSYFCIFASKSASLSGVHFFNSWNSKKCSDNGVLGTFWLQNVPCATLECTFRHLNFQKWLEAAVILAIFTSKSASRHNGVQFLISQTTRWLRTRRLSEPTFWASGATKHGKTLWFATFLPFRAPSASFLWLLLFSDFFLLPFSSLALHTSAASSIHIVGSLTF